MENKYYFELVKEKLKYFKTRLDSIDGELIDIPSDDRNALNDVSAIYIYCSADLKTYYIGQTNSILRRHKEHLTNEKEEEIYRQKFYGGTLLIFYGDNISGNLNYIESSLIKIFKEWSEIYDFKVLNSPDGNKSDYFQAKREVIDKVISKIIKTLHEQNVLNVWYDDTNVLKAILFRNSPFYELEDQQKEIFEKLTGDGNEKLFIVRGGAGTGKTVILNHTIAKLLGRNIQKNEGEKNIRIGVCLKSNMSKIINGIFKVYVKNTKDFGLYIGTWKEILEEAEDEKFDYILVDEAQRLLKYSKSIFPIAHREYLELKENQNVLNLILRSTLKTILFYDDFQTIRPTDIDRIDDANGYNPTYNFPRKDEIYDSSLVSQYRIKINSNFKDYNKRHAKCYVDYIKYMLQLSDRKPSSTDFLNYAYFKLVDDWNEIKEYINNKRNKFPFKKSRILAGFSREDSYNGKRGTKNRKIISKAWHELDMIWNKNYKTWATNDKAENEMGAIHSVQGYDFDYVGVIMGKDIKVISNNLIDINPKNYKDARGKSGIANNREELKKYIQNCYYTLLTRGIYGIRLYIEDPELRKYWKERTEELKQDNS
ncbi:DUF2075 domain-containing protein [Streptococcus oralis]|uniref:DNA/RNA helicase domain-containing protein n=1 Tax=Streptococcus oralis TaxID=1303 RepID=UPI0018E16BDD|nr:DNA/RNA helicase domain-containing protein [Streptococcus oralis]QQC01102.1 DUF2075 domain-containing protein [Streptococcus oralis]